MIHPRLPQSHAFPVKQSKVLPPDPQLRPVPFRDATEAWFWTMAALVARREASAILTRQSGPPRPTQPEDILRCLDNLYRRRRIDLLHARILRLWGERGIAPNPARAGERCDALIWREALERLEWPLRVKGYLAQRHE